jgi:ferredoxin
MTPFGIRKKIKQLLGLENNTPSPTKPTRPTYSVQFVLANDHEYSADAKEGDSLVLTSGRSEAPISTGCTDGTCGTCQVEVLEGADGLTLCSEHESKTKANNGIDASRRLGCQTAVIGTGVKVKIINVLGEELVG